MYILRPYQKAASDAAIKAFSSKRKQNGILVLPTGCHAKGSQVLMYNGEFIKVENVKIGDVLMGNDGTPRTVLELHRGVDEMFKITPIKGDSFVVNGGHILSLYKTNEGNGYKSCQSRIDEISVYGYLLSSSNYKHLHKLYKPNLLYFGNEHRTVKDPYLLGLYLGDGCTVGGSFAITTMRTEVCEYLNVCAEEKGLRVRVQLKNNGLNKAKTYYIVGEKKRPNPITEWIKSLGLFEHTAGFKFIPHTYKTASVSDRYQLLAGLLDTDSFYDKEKNTYEYCSKSKQLAEDVVFLCRSLGLFAQIGKVKVVDDSKYYRIQISGDLDKIPCKVTMRKGRARMQKKSVLVTGFKVEHIGRDIYYGFTLDGNHLYCDSQMFVHHNSGKSLIIADIAYKLDSPLLIFQPSKEILIQNYQKLLSYGYFDCSVFSASVGRKDIAKVTFATIGSAFNKMEQFRHFKYVMIDECHDGVNPKGGQMEAFLHDVPNRKVIGLTATPYRLAKTLGGSELRFLTRTRPRIFADVLYFCQISDLLAKGYLAHIDYFDVSSKISFDINNVKSNSTGADFDDRSLQLEYERSGFAADLVNWTIRVMHPNDGTKRKGVLVFTKFVKEANQLVKGLEAKGYPAAVVTGETPKKERDRILNEFKAGRIKVVANAAVLVCGFDYPELDTVILAKPTKSLAQYYQMVGRCIRPCPSKKTAWVIDMCSSYRNFGKVADLRIECPAGTSKWMVTSKGRQLTNISF